MKNTIYIKTIQNRILINLSIFILTLCTTLPLAAQEWQWLQHAGTSYESGGKDDELRDFFVDSAGNSYMLIEFPRSNEAILFGDTIEHKHKVKYAGRCYSLASLCPNGEVRWYKTLYGTQTTHFNDTVYEHTSTASELFPGSTVAFDGTHIIWVAAGCSRIRLTDGIEGDSLLPVHPFNPQHNGHPSNNYMTRDIILKIDLEGNIVWQNSINELYPVPVSGTIYEGYIEIGNVFVDDNKNIHIKYKFSVSNNSTTTLPIQPNYEKYIVKLTPEGEFIETITTECECGYFNHFQNGCYYQIGIGQMDYYTIGGRYLWELCDTTGFNVTSIGDHGPDLIAKFSENGEFEWVKLLDTLQYFGIKNNLTKNSFHGDYIYMKDALVSYILKLDLEGNIVDSIPTHKPLFAPYGFPNAQKDDGFLAHDFDFLNEETFVLGGNNGGRDTLILSDHISIPDAFGPAIALFHIPTETFIAAYCGQTFKHTQGWSAGVFTFIGIDPIHNNIYGAGLFTSYSQTFGDHTIYNYNPSSISAPASADIFVTKLGWSEGEEGTWPDSPPVTVTEANAPIELNLYPNPAQSSFNLVSENNPIGKIEVYNLTGQRVIDLPGFGFTQAAINIAHLPAGLYVVKIETRKGWVEKKLVVGDN